MIRFGLYILIFALTLTTASFCQADSITYGPTINISGGLKLVDSALCFADGTCQTSAAFSDGSAVWGQITGYIDSQLDLTAVLLVKEDKANKGQPSGYAGLDSSGKIPLINMPLSDSFLYQRKVSVLGVTPEYQNQGATWLELPEFVLEFHKTIADSFINVSFADNIGISSNSWCNIGIFIDGVDSPICSGSWSGVYGNLTFNQQHLSCVIRDYEISPGVPGSVGIGTFTFRIKHRSNGCYYGNYAFDEFGINRALTLRELK